MDRASRWAWQSRLDDRGGVALSAAIISIPLVALGGLFAVDAFGVLGAHERADALATEAARAATQAIDLGKAVPGDAYVADPAGAVAAGQAYLAKAGVSGTVTVVEGGTAVEVTVTTSYDGRFTPMSWTVDGSSRAALLHGISEPEEG